MARKPGDGVCRTKLSKNHDRAVTELILESDSCILANAKASCSIATLPLSSNVGRTSTIGPERVSNRPPEGRRGTATRRGKVGEYPHSGTRVVYLWERGKTENTRRSTRTHDRACDIHLKTRSNDHPVKWTMHFAHFVDRAAVVVCLHTFSVTHSVSTLVLLPHWGPSPSRFTTDLRNTPPAAPKITRSESLSMTRIAWHRLSGAVIGGMRTCDGTQDGEPSAAHTLNSKRTFPQPSRRREDKTGTQTQATHTCVHRTPTKRTTFASGSSTSPSRCKP